MPLCKRTGAEQKDGDMVSARRSGAGSSRSTRRDTWAGWWAGGTSKEYHERSHTVPEEHELVGQLQQRVKLTFVTAVICDLSTDSKYSSTGVCPSPAAARNAVRPACKGHKAVRVDRKHMRRFRNRTDCRGCKQRQQLQEDVMLGPAKAALQFHVSAAIAREQ